MQKDCAKNIIFMPSILFPPEENWQYIFTVVDRAAIRWIVAGMRNTKKPAGI